MPNGDTVRYTCDVCSYVNIWTRDEIVQRGQKVIFRGDDDGDVYSLPCKNPQKPACSGRRRIQLDAKD